MAKYVFLALSNPTEGQEEEYNRWYDEQHAGDVLKVPGFLSCQRYTIADEQAGSAKYRYLAIYEVETDSVADTQAAMAAAGAAGAMPLSPAINLSDVIFQYYKVSGDKVLAK